MKKQDFYFAMAVALLVFAAEISDVLVDHADLSQSLNPLRFLPHILYLAVPLTIGAYARARRQGTGGKPHGPIFGLMWFVVIVWISLSVIGDASGGVHVAFEGLAIELAVRVLFASIPALTCVLAIRAESAQSASL